MFSLTLNNRQSHVAHHRMIVKGGRFIEESIRIYTFFSGEKVAISCEFSTRKWTASATLLFIIFCKKQ